MAETSLAAALAEAARELQQRESVEELLHQAVWVADRDIEPCDGAAVSIVDRSGQIDTPAATNHDVLRSDVLQNELGEGPCLDAIWERKYIEIHDLRADDRWPIWGPRTAADVGFRSMVSFHVFTHADKLGALSLYSRRVGGFVPEDVGYGRALAAQVALALSAARKVDQLDEALASRTTIGIATGIIMERYSVDSDRAFALLKRLSSTANRKIRDIAADLVAGGALPEPENDDGRPPPGDDVLG